MKPIVFDLFCGLRQAKLRGGTDALIKKLMARRTQDPNHVRFAIRHQPPRTVSFKFWSVSYFQNSGLLAGLTFIWSGWVSSAHPLKRSIFKCPAGVVNFLNAWILFVKRLPLTLGRNVCTLVGAIAPIAFWMLRLEVNSANTAIAPLGQNISYLTVLFPQKQIATFLRTVKFVRPL